jgi:hypothetical protein
MQDVVKLVQTQLSRKGLKWTRQQVKDYLDTYEGSLDDVVDIICAQPEVKQPSAITKQTPVDLSKVEEEEKEIEVKNIASEMQIDLPIEAIKQIASSVTYALDSRAEFLEELRGAIKAWANKVNQKLQTDVDNTFAEVNSEVQRILAEDNQRIVNMAQSFKEDVEASVESFRQKGKEAITIFRV